MENQEMQEDNTWRKIEKTERRGKIVGGLLIVGIGSLFLMQELGFEIPSWVLTWKMLLISLGIVVAVKHKFLNPSWLILIGIGGAFLLNDIYPELHIKPFLWPLLIILIGLFIMFKPRRKKWQYGHEYWKKWQQHNKGHRGWNDRRHQWQYGQFVEKDEPLTNSPNDEYFDSVSFMGGTKKNILSKTFKGGDIVNIFGGSHLNLSQADIEGTVTLSITQVFGGTKLIVPANWEIKLSETVTVCGSIEDKRPAQAPVVGEVQKVLILVGVTVFGGIEIKSFD